MQTEEVIQYAHALYRAHGDKAEFEAAQRVKAEREKGNEEQAETWQRIRLKIKEIRGPRAT